MKKWTTCIVFLSVFSSALADQWIRLENVTIPAEDKQIVNEIDLDKVTRVGPSTYYAEVVSTELNNAGKLRMFRRWIIGANCVTGKIGGTGGYKVFNTKGQLVRNVEPTNLTEDHWQLPASMPAPSVPFLQSAFKAVCGPHKRN